MKNFLEITNNLSSIVERDIETRYNRYIADIDFKVKFYYSVKAWCSYLQFSEEIIDFIVRESTSVEIEELSQCIYEEGKTTNKTITLKLQNLELPTLFSLENKLYRYINNFFSRIYLRSNDMNIIVFIAFVIAAVGYWIYTLNKPKPQESTTRQADSTPTPSQQPSYQLSQTTSRVSTPQAPVQVPVKKSLILVIPAAQESMIDSIKAKGTIDYDDCEKLYEATQYLCQQNESDVGSKLAQINLFKAIEKSEYDIYIVKIELSQADEGFNNNVSQLDRYDAFRNLYDLAVNIQVSPRLQMEAYGNFDVYNR